MKETGKLFGSLVVFAILTTLTAIALLWQAEIGSFKGQLACFGILFVILLLTIRLAVKTVKGNKETSKKEKERFEETIQAMIEALQDSEQTKH